MLIIPKFNANTLGIGLLDVLWKVIEAIIDTHIKKAVTFHYILHGFCSGRVMGTAIMDLNLAKYLACVYQDPLLLVFLYLRKLYDNLDQFRILHNLEGYGAGPKMRGILAELWER